MWNRLLDGKYYSNVDPSIYRNWLSTVRHTFTRLGAVMPSVRWMDARIALALDLEMQSIPAPNN